MYEVTCTMLLFAAVKARMPLEKICGMQHVSKKVVAQRRAKRFAFLFARYA